ncbi:chemokine-like factor [Talpa occidentalis]|uniref:chemokine-like factor n=1 Tax=Talpa occidentalis TaxID=50954 RepID=UPI00188DF48D|nr:chemokine-like factor [Talpa occidentalis]
MPVTKVKGRPFCFSVKGQVKIIRLALTVTSMTLFIIAQAPEPYIVVTGFEVVVVLFFIILYMLRLDRYMTFLFWPLLDVVNSLVTVTFMIIIAVLALLPETTLSTVLGGVFGFLAAVSCLVDAALIYRKLLFNPGGPYKKTSAHNRI